jgi:hypothetical protein
MTNIIKYKKFVSNFLLMFILNKNEIMPVVITKSTFQMKNVIEKERG